VENLKTVKKVLIEFGAISGLETNVEKTSLMPIGCLDEPIEQGIIDLGFELVNSMKCLGLEINNRASNLTDHFDEKTTKIRQLIGLWGRYNLSLTGRIAISKTMLVSQIGYIGCIITPTANQLATLQSLIKDYVTTGIVVAADRLYTRPCEGGLGLINLDSYLAALQCSWIKRCYNRINDSWRWVLASACDFILDNLRPDMFNKTCNPVLYDITVSFQRLQNKYWNCHENFLMAPLVDNRFFMRAKPERRAPVRGCIDRNLLGHDFYDTNRSALRALRMNCLVRGNRIVDHGTLTRTTGIEFTPASYLLLVTAGKFAITKYANKAGSNGTSLPLSWYLQRAKKGSKKFRRLIEKNFSLENQIVNLRVVQTFFQLTECVVPNAKELGFLYGSWSWSFLSNQVRFFCFQFFNNSLAISARIAARYRNGGIIVDQRCTFCIKSGTLVPYREEFLHVFYNCESVIRLRDNVARELFPPTNSPDSRRLWCFTGLVPVNNDNDRFFYVLTSILLNYVLWQCKIKKLLPSTVTILYDIDFMFENICTVSSRIRVLAMTNNSLLCRRWRTNGHGRG
jgi:hypothetical protein